MNNPAYSRITDEIIKSLEAGVIPWKKPWTGIEPQNYQTKSRYNGINYFLLANTSYKYPYFLTFNQCRALGGSIKKGSKGIQVIYWQMLEKTKDNPEDKTEYFPLIKVFTVFNIDQTANIELKLPQTLVTFTPAEQAEQLLSSMVNKPEIKHNNQQAYYSPSADYISIPQPEQFANSNEYYSTLFHELIHSTGHANKLNRANSGSYGSEDYAKEELIAELGSAFLCSRCGIDNTITNTKAYIQSWLKALKNDPKLIVMASARAEKAVNYLLGKSLLTK